jgi:lysyl endopeptidase
MHVAFVALLALVLPGAGLAAGDDGLHTLATDLAPLIADAADEPSRFAVAIPHRITLGDAGEWSTVGTHARWRYRLHVPTAVSLSFHATEVVLPSGSTLNVSGATASHLYTQREVRNGAVWSRIVRGDILDVELTVPVSARAAARFQIETIQVGYRGLGAGAVNHPQYERLRAARPARAKPGFNSGAVDIGANSACIENFECSRTATNTGPSRSTIAIVVGNTVQCTGTLINNVRQDGTPYVLTARHCQNGAAGGGSPALAAASSTVYWNATSACGTVLGDLYDPAIRTQTGATTEFEQQDAWLLRLDRDPVIESPFFSGFDASGAAIVGGYTIHHALSTKQQIVKWNGQAVPVRWPGTQLGVQYVSDLWAVSSRIGYYGPGASGGALFDESDRLVATSSLGRESDGGPGTCPSVPPKVPAEATADGYFTSLAAIWASVADGTSTSGGRTLASILDPDGTGRRVVDGSAGLSRIALYASAPSLGIDSTLGLTWNAAGASSCTASGGIPEDGWSGAKPAVGTMSLRSSAVVEAQYDLTCNYPDGRTGRASVKVTWTVPQPFGYFTGLSSPQVWAGAPTIVSWVSNTGPCSITSPTAFAPGTGLLTGLPVSGSTTVVMDRPGATSLELTCGPGTGTQLSSITLSVVEPEVQFFANGTERRLGEHLSLVWYSLADYCTPTGGAPGDGWIIAQRGGNSGFFPVIREVGTYTYGLICASGAVTLERSVTVRITNDPPYATLSVTPDRVGPGETYEVYTRSNIDNCYLSGLPYLTSPLWVSAESRSFRSTYLTGTYTLQLSCASNGQTATAPPVTLTVAVAEPPPPVNVTLTASASSIPLGQSVTLTWSSTNATACEAVGEPIFSGPLPTAGSRTITPTTAGNLVMSVQCAGRTGASGAMTVIVNVTAPPQPPPPPSGGSGGGNGGGGGSLDLLLLLLLSVTTAVGRGSSKMRPREVPEHVA